ncbi:prevent-host-death protein [Rhizobium sp. AU243]|nr:prevent-host-death protein [Rhizobium sp. AU243]
MTSADKENRPSRTCDTTDRDKPPHVLMTYSRFKRLIVKRRNLIDALSMSGLSTPDLNTPRAEIGTGVDLS